MRSVLITRPQPAADEFAEKLRRAGFQAYVAPVMEYVALGVSIPLLSGFDALIFTSAQAVHAFAEKSSERNLPVLAVGDATAATAVKRRFTKVYSARGTSDDVASLIKSKRQELSLKRLLHVCGEDTVTDMNAAMLGLGIEIARLVLYKAVFLESFPDKIMQALLQGKIDTVTFFSARTAAQFLKIVQQRELRALSVRLEAVCMSERIAAEIKSMLWRAVRVAHHPDMEGMMEILTEKRAGIVSQTALNADLVIDGFGGLRPLAQRLGITASTVQGWKKRGTIPEARVESVLDAAQEDGINTEMFWQEGHKKMTGDEQNTETETKAEAEKRERDERRRSEDRRVKHTAKDARGTVRAPTYVGQERREGFDRRAYEARQKERIKHEKMKFLNHTVVTAAFMFTAIAGAGLFLMAPEYFELQQRAERATQLEKEIEQLRAHAPLAAPAPKSASMGAALNHQIEKMGDLSTYVSTAVGDAAGAMQTGSLRSLIQVLNNAQSMRNIEGGGDMLSRSLSTLKNILSSSPSDPNAVNAAVDAARQHDAGLKGLLGSVAVKDLAAAAMLLTLNEFRSNIDNHRPYAQDLAVLEKFAGNDPVMNKSLQKLAPYAEKGVMSRDALQTEFKGLAGDIVTAKLQGADLSVKDQALKRLRRLVKIRKTDDVEGKSPDAVVARAQIMLNKGDVKGAVAQLKTLEGEPAQVAQPWVENASGYVAANESSDALMQSILQAMSGEESVSLQGIISAVKSKISGPSVPYVSPSLQRSSVDNPVVVPSH
jgi:uroporphyrinogen-III synthase